MHSFSKRIIYRSIFFSIQIMIRSEAMNVNKNNFFSCPATKKDIVAYGEISIYFVAMR